MQKPSRHGGNLQFSHSEGRGSESPGQAVVKPAEPVSSGLVGDPASINKMETDHERQVTSISGLHIHIREHLLTHTMPLHMQACIYTCYMHINMQKDLVII